MPRKVILIYPEVSPNMDFHWFPWSVLGVGQTLQNQGVETVIWDQRVQSEDELFEQLDDTFCVGISVMVGHQVKKALEIAQHIRVRHPHIPLVWGGMFANSAYREILTHEFVDIVAVGPGEVTMPEIVRNIENGEWAVGCKKVQTAPSGDVSSLPRWRFGMIDIERYINPETKAMAYLSSFGCTHRCSFCHIGRTKGWYPLANEVVIDELQYLIDKYQFRNITFHDANFFASEKRTMELATEFLKRKLIPATWHANARADQLLKYSDATLEKVVESGCNLMFIGVETGAKKLYPLMNKRESLEEIAAFVERFSVYPINLHLHFMFGLPGETPDDVMETINYYNLLEGLNNHLKPVVHFYSPYPYTALFEKAKEAGYVPPETLEDWGRLDSLEMASPWLDKVTRERIETLVKENMGISRGDRRELFG